MNILKKCTIRQRFLALFFVCILTFIGFGIFALFQLSGLAKLTNSLYNQSAKVSNAAVNAKVDLIKINSALKDAILSGNTKEVQEPINKIDLYNDDLQKNLDIISQNSSDPDIEKNLDDINNILSKWWKPQRDKIIDNVLSGKTSEAISVSNGISLNFVDQLEFDLDSIYSNSSNNEIDLIQQSNRTENSVRITLIATLITLTVILLVLFMIIMRSILMPINDLINHMIKTAGSGNFEEYKINQKDEISEMAKHYNLLIHNLKTKLWVNNAQNSLKDEISNSSSVIELTQKVINYLSRNLEVGKGTFYTYVKLENKLVLTSSFAFSEREKLSNIYEIGEGVIGQVALEKKPIHLKKVSQTESVISTATILEPPSNIYAFPLVYENELYGVIELSSFDYFSDFKKNFLDEVSNTIAVNLYSEIQRERIKELLKRSEESEREAKKMSAELKNTNEVLEEQQRQLQVQAEELQQSNSQLEEQQQILQQQSEELQQTNSQLEEHQIQMEEQSRTLSFKNQELEKSREEILSRTRELEAANKYKSQFLANVSHELRTPLNSIILLSNLLIRNGKDKFEAGTMEKFKVIYNSGQHLLRLISNILDLSKIEAGKMEFNYNYFNTGSLTIEIADIFNEMAREKNIEFIIEDDFKGEFYGDKDKIAQIIRNFLSNAFKFTEKGHVKLKIEKQNDNLVFSVSDTGIGISRDKLNIVFEEFHQGDGSISRKYGGTGLGLSISSKLCEIMKGKIEVTSELGFGSTFYLNLPFEAAQNDISNNEIAAAVGNDSKNLLQIHKENLVKNNLLIIEKSESLQKSVKNLSEGIGFNTITAHDYEEGIKFIKECEIHGVLLDLEFKDDKEIFLLKEIYKTLNLKNTKCPIIIYTSVSMSLDQEKQLNLYADRIIIKTANSDERLMDELTLILHKVNNKEENKSIITSKINKDTALDLINKKILIVDDDPRNIFVLAAALEEYNAEIIEAENGKIALNILENQRVDLILMDIMMPVMNGYDTIKKIRSLDNMKDIPIIVTTAKSLKGDKEKCMAAGANDYISKPINYDILITLIKAWINKD